MNRNFWYILGIGLLLICVCIILSASAEPIMQGQCVELNKTYDIAGIGWYNEKIVYYGQWYDAYSNDDNSSVVAMLKIPSGISKLQNFYIDPVFFSNYTGYWYNSYEFYEPGGNSRLFYVAEKCKVENKTEPAPIIVNKSFEFNQTILPTRSSGYDLLLARGDTIEIQNQSKMRYWIFGPEYGNYDIENSVVMIHATDFQNNPPGKYTVAIVSPGPNGILEEYFNQKDVMIESVFKAGSNEYVRGLLPAEVKDRLGRMVKQSYDDTIEYITISFDDPIIQIVGYEQIDRANNKSYLDIRGYTNVKAGTVIKAELESETLNLVRYPRVTVASTVVEYNPSEWRQFKLLLPFNINELPNGKHFVIVSTPYSPKVVIEPYIKEELAEHYIPPGTIRYVDNNPFIPTPTPEIMIVLGPTRIVTQIVTVQLTPDYDTLAKAQNEKWWITFIQTAETVLMYGFVILAICSFIAYVGWVYFRGKKGKEM